MPDGARELLVEASFLLALHKHDGCATTVPELQETIRNFTEGDLARVEQIAARLKEDGRL